MKRNYTFFNVSSLFAILLAVFLLIATFQNTTDSDITFEDPGLEQAIRDAIGKEEGAIKPTDIDLIQELDATGYGIENLEGIEALSDLRILNLEDNFIKSVLPLQNSVRLEVLNLANNEISNLEKIDFEDIIFLNIRELNLNHNVVRDEEGNDKRLSDISMLAHLTTLRELKLRDNHIEEISSLSNLRNLRKLDLRENKLKDITAIETLTFLEELNIRDNGIKSLEPLRYLTQLIYLNIHSNSEIETLEPLSELVNLETLIMRNVPITDGGEFLKKLTKLQRFNAIDSNYESIDSEIIEYLRSRGALNEEVRPVRMLHTLEAPIIAKNSGFYTESFELEIDAPTEESTIYYTLDGSEPTLESTIYKKPIDITPIGSETLTIVRARTLAEGNTLSETVTKSYFVHKEADRRFDLPVFSIVSDPENLFGVEKGIYHEANQLESGSDWERPIHVDFFENNGNLKFEQELGVRLHGEASRTYDQKSLRLYAKDEYDTEDYMNVDFFNGLQSMHDNEEVTTFKRILLRSSGNDWSQTMFNDALMQSLVAPLETVETQAYQPSVVFINGEYYGIHNIRERYDEYYFETHYNITEDDLVILENNGELYRGNTSDAYHYRHMIQFIEENSLQENENYAYIQTLMDTENFRDYFASQIYFGNSDWPHNNIRFWRKKTDSYVEDAPVGHDGRWRWLLFDTDHGYYYSDKPYGNKPYPLNHYHNTIDYVMGELDGRYLQNEWPNFLFRSLMSNQQFKNDFLNRINDLMNSYFSAEAGISEIDRKVEGIENEMPSHIERWGAIESMEQWRMYIDRKYTFANERPELLRGFIMEEFGIEKTITVTVGNETESGYIRLNTIDITNELPGNSGKTDWSGIYFAGIPINIEAVANDGYEFSHWEGISQLDKRVEIPPNSDLSIRAVFTPINE